MQIDKCPHCNATHVIAAQQYQAQFIPNNNAEVWSIERCQNPKCNKLILVKLNARGDILGIHPAASFDLDDSLTITASIKEDYKEAGLCLEAGCFKSSAVMSRRVLQGILKEQGCNQRNLVDQIDHAIANDILRKPIQRLATEIREYGNLGAHPDDKQLAEIDQGKAKHILNFARLIIEEFYEIPDTAQKLQQERTPPATPPPP